LDGYGHDFVVKFSGPSKLRRHGCNFRWRIGLALHG
jgi:hypothetical protein